MGLEIAEFALPKFAAAAAAAAQRAVLEHLISLTDRYLRGSTRVDGVGDYV